MTLRDVVNDIHTVLKQKYDDQKITFTHTLYHVLIYANRLKAQHIEKRDTNQYVHVFNEVAVQKDSVTKRQYLDMPAQIFDFDRDGGINYITYSHDIDDKAFTSVTFQRTRQSAAKVLYWNEDTHPAPDNPYFFMESGKIFLLGLEDIDSIRLEVGLYSAFDIESVTNDSLDENFDFPLELLPVLQRQVLDIGRFALLIPEELSNDGTSGEQQAQAPTTKIIPVNQTT